MPLEAFQAETLTFAYPDSMASLPIAKRDDHVLDRKDYHDCVFTLPEIQALVTKFALPRNRWKTDSTMEYDKFVEVQVWDHTPINEFLTSA